MGSEELRLFFLKGESAVSQRVYLLLTRSNTIVSRAIYQITKDDFTHCSISLDSKMEKMYSFCRRHPYLAYPAGLTTESIYQGFYLKHATIPCQLYYFDIEDGAYQTLEKAINSLMRYRKELKYDLLGTIFCQMNKPHRRSNHRYCSWFIAELLDGLHLLRFEKDVSLVRPMDFAIHPCLTKVYSGSVGNLVEKFNANEI